MIDSLTALSLPTAVSDIAQPSTLLPANTVVASGADFQTMLAQVVGEATSSLKTAESSSIALMQGKTTTQQTVDAILSAERSLQTTLAIRDKLVSAFQEISRMSV